MRNFKQFFNEFQAFYEYIILQIMIFDPGLFLKPHSEFISRGIDNIYLHNSPAAFGDIQNRVSWQVCVWSSRVKEDASAQT